MNAVGDPQAEQKRQDDHIGIVERQVEQNGRRHREKRRQDQGREHQDHIAHPSQQDRQHQGNGAEGDQGRIAERGDDDGARFEDNHRRSGGPWSD